jgi:hypothetical protein
VVVSWPSHGALTWNTNTQFSYEVTDGSWYGWPDSFTYKVRDADWLESTVKTVNIADITDS